MPTTLTGLFLFVVLLLPGITYVVVRERSSPERRWSAFRETATVAAVSAIANTTALLLFAIIHQLLPDVTPSLGSFIERGSQYWEDEYSSIIGWGTGTLGFAVSLAAGAAAAVRNQSPHPSKVSSWWILFDDYARRYSPNGRRSGLRTTATCRLIDGAVYRGVVFDYNPAVEETGDRDLILGTPVERYSDGQIEKLESQLVCISARQIAALEVEYRAKENPPQVGSLARRIFRWFGWLTWRR